MAFPTSPSNGQVTTLNGVRYTYATATNSWARQAQASVAFNVLVDTFTGTGSTASFTLTGTPQNSDFVQVNIDGVSQLKTAFTISGKTITFTSTPVSGQVIEVRTTVSKNMGVLTGLNYDTFTGNGVANTYTLTTSPVNENYTMVTIGGVVQNKNSYSISGTSLTFDTAPPDTAPVEITTFGPAINTATPGGSNNEIQINRSGVLSTNANLTFDSSTLTLSANNISASNVTVSGTLTANATQLASLLSTQQLANALVAGTVYSSSQPNITSVGTLTSLNVSGVSNYGLTSETLNIIYSATGVTAHDVSAGSTFYHITIAGAVTPNFTNVPTTDSRILVCVLVISQGATPFTVSSTQIRIDGVTYTVKWSSSTAPVGSANKIDVISYSLLRAGDAWFVLGQYSTYA